MKIEKEPVDCMRLRGWTAMVAESQIYGTCLCLQHPSFAYAQNTGQALQTNILPKDAIAALARCR